MTCIRKWLCYANILLIRVFSTSLLDHIFDQILNKTNTRLKKCVGKAKLNENKFEVAYLAFYYKIQYNTSYFF